VTDPIDTGDPRVPAPREPATAHTAGESAAAAHTAAGESTAAAHTAAGESTAAAHTAGESTAADTDGTKRAGWRTWAVNAVKIAFMVAVVVAGVLYVVGKWAEVSEAVTSMNPVWLVLAFVAVIVALVCSMLSWIVVWPAFGVHLPTLRGARVFFISQLGKYLPGSVWPIAAQAQMAGEVGLARSSSIVLSLISMLVSIATGLGVGGILLPFIDVHLLQTYWWLPIVGVAFLVCLTPPVMRFGVRLALRLLRRPDAQFAYGWRVAGSSSGLQAANWLAGGLQLWFVLVGLGVDPAKALVPAIAAFALAFALGVLLIPFPAGLGVREFVITVVLGSVTTPGVAVTAAVLSRLLYAVADFAIAGIAAWVGRRSASSR
jgi:glycosyltransferase 2 family protein